MHTNHLCESAKVALIMSVISVNYFVVVHTLSCTALWAHEHRVSLLSPLNGQSIRVLSAQCALYSLRTSLVLIRSLGQCTKLGNGLLGLHYSMTHLMCVCVHDSFIGVQICMFLRCRVYWSE